MAQGTVKRTSPPQPDPTDTHPPVGTTASTVRRLRSGVVRGQVLAVVNTSVKVTVVRARSWINPMMSSYTVVTAG